MGVELKLESEWAPLKADFIPFISPYVIYFWVHCMSITSGYRQSWCYDEREGGYRVITILHAYLRTASAFWPLDLVSITKLILTWLAVLGPESVILCFGGCKTKGIFCLRENSLCKNFERSLQLY